MSNSTVAPDDLLALVAARIEEQYRQSPTKNLFIVKGTEVNPTKVWSPARTPQPVTELNGTSFNIETGDFARPLKCLVVTDITGTRDGGFVAYGILQRDGTTEAIIEAGVEVIRQNMLHVDVGEVHSVVFGPPYAYKAWGDTTSEAKSCARFISNAIIDRLRLEKITAERRVSDNTFVCCRF